MRDRAFGVEIECGYNGEGRGHECECDCWCEQTRDWMRTSNERYSSAYYTTSQIENFECDVCRGSCGECRSYDDYDSLGCEVATNLLHDNGFSDWTDDIHQDGSGVEIPSPILRGQAGLSQLRQVLALLNREGFYVTSSDGGHVHHDAPEFVDDLDLVGHIVEMWEANQEHIDRFVNEQRRSHMEHGYCYPVSKDRIEEFKKDKVLYRLTGRTCAINVTGLEGTWGSGTIEFRQHEGTLDFNEWYSWIHFGQSFIDMAVKTYKRGQIVTCADPLDLLRKTRTSPKSTRLLLAKAAGRSVAYA